MTESVLLTATVEANERRDIATFDITNAFIQTEVDEVDADGDRIIMKIQGAMVDMLLEIDESYQDYVCSREDNVYCMYTSSEQSMECSCWVYCSTRNSEQVLKELGT